MLITYLDDGANYQAKAVLAYLSRYDGIEWSWNGKEYLAKCKVARWENCREQGYIISLHNSAAQRQLNIIWFEHRNSDDICAVEWEQHSINSLTIETANFGNVYQNKYDVSNSVGYGKASKMADWIYSRLELFWEETNRYLQQEEEVQP